MEWTLTAQAFSTGDIRPLHSLQARFKASELGLEARQSIFSTLVDRQIALKNPRHLSLKVTATLLAREREWDTAAAPRVRIEVRGKRSGYVQAVNRGRLTEEARKCDLRLVLCCRPGDFVLAGSVLLEVHHRADALLPPKLSERLVAMLQVGEQRTEEQDVRYGDRQLAEIACRALSPGINDPYTAMGCMDWMSAALARAAQREPARRFSVDARQAARMEEQPPGFAELCGVMWEPIIDYGLDSAIVVRHAMESLRRIAAAVQRPEDARAVQGIVVRLAAQTKEKLQDKAALDDVLDRARALEARLGEADGQLQTQRV